VVCGGAIGRGTALQAEGGMFVWCPCDFSGHVMTLVSTQPLTEMNTRNFCWG